MLNVSTIQASDLLSAKRIDEKEKKILRSAVQELQMRDEHSLIIGKLRQHILDLETSDLRSYQNIEKLNTTNLGLESQVLELEAKVESKDQLIYELRLKTNCRIQLMQKNMTSLRIKHSGVVSLEKHERICNSLRLLNVQKEKLSLKASILQTKYNTSEGFVLLI
jgi:hypothetical protein